MLNKMIKMRNKKGFTLIELIVVLVIMAILAAFAIPTMMGAVEDARKSSYLANCRAVYIAGQAGVTAQLVADSIDLGDSTKGLVKYIDDMVPELKGKVKVVVSTDMASASLNSAGAGDYVAVLSSTDTSATAKAKILGVVFCKEAKTAYTSLIPSAQ